MERTSKGRGREKVKEKRSVGGEAVTETKAVEEKKAVGRG